MGSKKWTLDGNDLAKLGKGALIAAAGAALTYLVEEVPNVDFGSYTPAVVAAFGIAINFARKLLADYSK